MDIELPKSFLNGKRRYFKRSEIEHAKHVLLAKAAGQIPPKYVEPKSDTFMSAPQVAAEFAVSQRTIARAIKATDVTPEASVSEDAAYG